MRALLVIVATLLFDLSEARPSGDPKRDIFGDRALLRGMDAFGDGRHADALKHFEIALKAVPSGSDLEAQALLLAALTATEVGRPDDALTYTHDLAQRLPEIRDYVWYGRATAFRNLGRWNDALELWQQIVRQTPDSPLERLASFSIGDAYYALGQLRQAADHYDVLLKKHRRHDRAETARFTRARIAEALNDHKKAADLYLEIGFRTPLAYFAPDAIRRHQHLVQARKASPPGFYDRLGRVDRFLSARAIDKARAELEPLRRIATTDTQRRSLAERSARLLFREDRFDEARSAFKQLARSSKGSQRIRFLSWVSRSLSAQGRFDEAVDVYEKLARDYRGRREARSLHYKAAWLAYNGGDYKRSLELFSDFVATFGHKHDVDDAQWFIAWNHYRIGNEQAALNALRKFQREYPRSKLLDRTHYWEARILHRAGRLEEATRAYQRVMSRDPNGYYAVYAKQRLFELAEDVAPGRDPKETLASLGALRFATTDRRPAGYEPQTTQAPLRRAPHHGAAFAWDSPTGKRALRLMTLGFLGDATDLVRRVPAISDVDQEHVHFARARLLYSLGDYHAAYRIALVHLRDRVAEGYSPALRRTFEMLYPRAHPALVNAAATEWGVPELFLLSVIRQESAFDDRARSWVSARGLMQIIPPTASRIADALQFEDFHPGLLNDPEINVRFGGWYLKALLDSYRGHPLLALGGYNAGPAAMNRWVKARHEMQTDEFIEEIPYSETRSYVKRIVANLSAYHTLYGGSFEIPNRLQQPTEDAISF